MYCPVCSTKVSLEQKFCRSCGFGLEKVAQSVGEQLPTKLAEDLEERKNNLERLGVIALSIFGIGVGSFFLYIFVNKIVLLLGQGKTLGALGLAALILVLACGLVSVILFAKAKEVQEAAIKRRLQPTEDQCESAATAKLLREPHIEPISSVTDRTTELLYAERESGSKEVDTGACGGV